MADYQSKFSGIEVDAAVRRLLNWANAGYTNAFNNLTNEEWSTYDNITVATVEYAVLWHVAPTAENQVYGYGMHKATGRLYQIYSDHGIYTVTALDANTNTTNTTGATLNTTDKLYLVGAVTQDTDPVTYSHNKVYEQSGKLYSDGKEVLTAHPTISINTDTTSTASPTAGGTFTAVDSITRDNNGHVTQINTKTVTLPADSDTKVTQEYSSTSNNYPVLASSTSGISSTNSRGATTAILNNQIYLNPNTGALYAKVIYKNNNEVATLNEVDTKIAALGDLLEFKGTKSEADIKALTSASKGDVWLDTATGYEWVCIKNVSGSADTTAWEQIGKNGAVVIDSGYTPLRVGYTTSGQNYAVLKDSSTNKLYVYVPWTDTTYSSSTGISQSGTVFSLKTASANEIGGVKIAGIRESAIETTAGGTTAGRYYGVEIDSNGKAFVNVPWVNDNTTYSAGSGLSMNGTIFNHSNAVTAQTTQALYPIKIDAQGHISAYGTAVTSLKNPTALKLKTNTDTDPLVTYDGSLEKVITVKPSSTAGAFTIDDGTTTKTIQLAGVFTDNNTATAADNILDGSNSGTQITYAPYSSQQSKLSFDTSSTNPTRTDRLNLNGYLYATKLYSNGSEVLTAHPTISTAADTTSTPTTLAHSGTFTAITSVTRDSNGHVTKLNTATYTLPASGNTHNSHAVISGVKSNGSTNIISETSAGNITLGDSGVLASGTAVTSYGDSGNQTPNFGATFKVPSFTVNSKGILVAAGEHTVKIPTVTITHNSHSINSGKQADGTTNIISETSSTDLTLGDSGVTAGSYGSSTGSSSEPQEPGYGGSFIVPYITVNAKGIVTGVSNKYVKIPASDNSHNSHGVTVISGKKSDGTTDITASSSQTTSGLHSVTLGDSGVTAGSYGNANNQTPGYEGTFNVPYITVNAKGIVTGIANKTVKIPASDNTNTWRKVQLNGTDKLGTGTGTNPLNIKAGSNMTITESSGTFEFNATDTTYSNATTAAAGLMSSTDKTRLDSMWNVWEADGTGDTLVNKVQEVLNAFANFSETESIISALNGKANSSHTHTKSEITDFPSSMPASDVYSWAKAATKPSYSWSEISSKPFSGVTFVSGNSDNGEHNANNATANGHYYYTSNGPSTDLGASTGDGALYVQSYSSDWVGQIAQDYRNGTLFVRGKNSGTWQAWKKVIDSGNIGSQSVNYANSAGSAPASDVYAWAKASSKPSYTHNEIGAGNITIGDGANTYYYRTGSGVKAGFYYHTAGDESVVFANQYVGTGWMFVEQTNPDDRTSWQSLSPTLQIKKGGVVINKLIGQGASPAYNLDVNGTANATSITINAKATMQYNATEDCIDFIFA